MTSESHGTSKGVELTDQLIERLAREAEEGYPVERLRARCKVCRGAVDHKMDCPNKRRK